MEIVVSILHHCSFLSHPPFYVGADPYGRVSVERGAMKMRFPLALLKLLRCGIRLSFCFLLSGVILEIMLRHGRQQVAKLSFAK